MTVAGLLALVLASCANEDSIPLRDASGQQDGSSVEVAGYVFINAGEVRICEAIAESFPPQCGGEFLFVDALDPAVLASHLVSAGGDTDPDPGLLWTNDVVRMSGQMAGGRLQFELLVED